MQAARDSLQRLGLDYVDLYLIHSPFKADTDYKKVIYEPGV
jgi:diketogulonate reductase-like aldo/keto reductase